MRELTGAEGWIGAIYSGMNGSQERNEGGRDASGMLRNLESETQEK